MYRMKGNNWCKSEYFSKCLTDLFITIKNLLSDVVDGCSPFSETLAFESFSLSKGKLYEQYNQQQCGERCEEDNKCFAVHFEEKRRYCWIHHANNDTIAFSKEKGIPNNNTEITVFFDELKLLDYSFKIEDVRVKEGIPKRDSFRTATESECVTKCIDDQICDIVAYKVFNKEESVNNCWLYSFEKVSCKIIGEKTDNECNTLTPDKEVVVWFNPVQRLKKDLSFI